MYKIRKVKFKNHPILNNLELNLCDQNEKTIDTIIIAGENGTGKSTILNELYNIASHNVKTPMEVEFEKDNKIFTITYFLKKSTISQEDMIYAKSSLEPKEIVEGATIFRKEYPFKAIFSEVDINFNASKLNSVTSLNLDSSNICYKSSNDLPTKMNQLLIDVQSLDDAEIAKKIKENPDMLYRDIKIDERMSRFTNAFNKMFDNLSYSHIENINSYKSIIFKKYGKPISIESLSSGEKQIVYRGAFLLKDINAMNGAFVFIDEPEISLHPTWQLKIMNFYKDIFTDIKGKQTSQIFAVTHSPFIIHNDNRINDKVIVLERDKKGDIIVKDKPEYFKCNSIEAVKDAFSIDIFEEGKSTVYLEGRTDEKYFKKAAEVFGIKLPFEFKCVGYVDSNGMEYYTGEKNLNNTFNLLVSKNLQYKNVCLYDCDTNKTDKEEKNVFVRCMPKYESKKEIKKGIENALVLDELDISRFFNKKTVTGDYGEHNIIEVLQKMDLCDYICSLENEDLKEIFKNLKTEIDYLITLF